MWRGEKVLTDFFVAMASEEVKGLFNFEKTRLRIVLDYLTAGEMLRE